MAALSTLAAQAKDFTATLPRPRFMSNASPADQTRSRPEKSLSASSLSTSSTTEETADESEEPQSANEMTRSSQRLRLGSEDTLSSSGGAAVVSLMPWELRDVNGDVVDSVTMREKVLELAVYRRTFAEDAAGEDEFTFQYSVRVSKQLHEVAY